jgi:hypothetical protein
MTAGRIGDMELNKEQTFCIPEGVLFQEVSGETVLLDLASESYFGLDSVGTRIWALLNEDKSVGQVLDALLEEYEVDRGAIEADLEELLESMLAAGLIQVLDPATPGS